MFTAMHPNDLWTAPIDHQFSDRRTELDDRKSPATPATVQVRTVYHATNNSDDLEGRGADVDKGYYLDLTTAQSAAGSGYTSKVSPQRGPVVEWNGKLYLLGPAIADRSPTQVLDVAIQKARSAGFTPEEAKALGIDLGGSARPS